MKAQITRRHFLKNATTAGLLLGVGGIPASAGTPGDQKREAAVRYRKLGKTGVQMSILGYGAMRTSDPAVIRHALDLGINNFDTARRYMDGHNEEILAKALGDQRKKVVITTKIPVGTSERMRADIEASLTALNTDYIDILLLHGLKRDDEVANPQWLEVLAAAKQAGKIRFAGFSTHNNMAGVIRAAIRGRFFDVVLAAYNFKCEPDLTRAIAEAAAAGLGLIAMKTQAGGYEDAKMGQLNPHQAALKWVLNDPNVCCAIPAMVTFDQLNENFLVMSAPFGWNDRKTLDRYGRVINSRLCRFCTRCSAQCPSGVAISDIQRCLMYAEGYGDEALARTAYAELSPAVNLTACQSCTGCTATCSNGVDIAANLQRAVQRFA
ncbi:MAG TPA: aldo/keto reductase [bacterium]|nr:aldo/keto reductase [bacterium]HQG46471.1 aldo/keto reductase [bacterium]HQI48579.1 aldo/keto reductase [bacterium]HQJ64035.1 aldo/keto reductase [bacterium]